MTSDLFCLHAHQEQGSTEGNPVGVFPYTNTRQIPNIVNKELDGK